MNTHRLLYAVIGLLGAGGWLILNSPIDELDPRPIWRAWVGLVLIGIGLVGLAAALYIDLT